MKKAIAFLTLIVVIISSVIVYNSFKITATIFVPLSSTDITNNTLTCNYKVRNNSLKTIDYIGYYFVDSEVEAVYPFDDEMYHISMDAFDSIDEKIDITFADNIDKTDYYNILKNKKIKFRFYTSLEANEFYEINAKFKTIKEE